MSPGLIVKSVLPAKSKEHLFRSLSVMISAGITLPQTLESLKELETEPRLLDFYETALDSLAQGRSFAESIRRASSDVGALNVALIEIAERTGSLELVLRRIADYESRSNRVRNRVASQLVYPLFLGLFALAGIFFLPGYCLSGILPVLRAEGGELSLLTRAFLYFSELTHNPLTWLLGGAGVALLVRWASGLRYNKSTRAMVFSLLDSTPIASGVLLHWRQAVLCECLALQLTVGLSPLKAFPLAAQATHDPRALDWSKEAVSALKSGATIPECLECWPGLPSLFVSMAEVGQESGRWPSLLQKLAEYHYRELEYAVERLVILLEPITICLMGLVFGLIILATLTPMINLVKGLS